MTEEKLLTPRVLVAAIMPVKSRVIEAAAKAIEEEMRSAKFHLVRSVVAKGEPQFIQQLVSNVSNDNEADAIVLVGGTGFGPSDRTCEALDSFVERRIEGFGEGYRRLLADEFAAGARALLVRATAGVFNQCVVFALTGTLAQVRRATQALIVPTLTDAVAHATGRLRSQDPWVTDRPK
ncbi:MAG: molybdenum cofactor biosynthesis protein B [Polyangiaceae bacterium]